MLMIGIILFHQPGRKVNRKEGPKGDPQGSKHAINHVARDWLEAFAKARVTELPHATTHFRDVKTGARRHLSKRVLCDVTCSAKSGVQLFMISEHFEF